MTADRKVILGSVIVVALLVLTGGIGNALAGEWIRPWPGFAVVAAWLSGWKT